MKSLHELFNQSQDVDSFRWDLGISLLGLQKNGHLCDIHLASCEDIEIAVHSCVIAAASVSMKLLLDGIDAEKLKGSARCVHRKSVLSMTKLYEIFRIFFASCQLCILNLRVNCFCNKQYFVYCCLPRFTIALPEVKSEILNLAVNFMYTGQVEVSANQLMDLLNTAKHLEVRDVLLVICIYT